MDVFDLVAKIRLDSSEYEQGVGKAKGTMSKLADGVKTGLATVAKVGAAAVAAGVAGVAALTKMGVEGYAQYEQLTGGVETLFKESGNAVMKYAENAYKTAGMSANQYMETVTSFSASLIQSLDGDTAKAAEIGNMAITDMSDNANKMGTSMELIQNAYQGFSKQNYTMLDNLKLGYGGTKEEMQRLLKDAEKISGIKYDISSFSDVTEAIHVMQESMGIAGTTAREAATTIEGSISIMKGAWQNLVVGMADENANMDVLINNFVESVGVAAQNLLPRIEQTLAGIGQLIEKMAPIIADALPKVVEALLPTIITAGITLITALANALVTALPAVKDALMEGLAIILTDVFGVSEDKARGFVDGLNSAFDKVADGFRSLVESAQTEGTFLNDVWTGLQDAGKAFCDLLVSLWDVLSAAFAWCVESINTEGTFLNTIWENIKTYISAGVDVITGIIKVFTAVLQGDWSGAWEAVKDVAKTIWNAISDIIENTLDWLKPIVSNAVEAIRNAISEKFEAAKAKVTEIFDSIREKISSAWEFIKSVVQVGIEFIVLLISAAFQLITLPFAFIWENCKETIIAVWEVIKSAVSNALNSIKDVISKVWNAISGVLSPILENIKNTIKTAWENVKTTMSAVLNAIKSVVTDAWNNVKSAVSGAIDSVKSAISSGMESAKSSVSSVLDSIKSKFTSIWDNCLSIVKNAVTALKDALNFSWKLPDLKLPHISVTGGVAPYGIGGKGSLPKFSISWYRKAYDDAMILNSPTIFGYSAASGKFLGGGDGNGNEIVAGESYLMNLIGNVVAEKNGQIVELLDALLEATVDGNGEMVRALKAGQVITLNERELGRAVRGLA